MIIIKLNYYIFHLKDTALTARDFICSTAIAKAMCQSCRNTLNLSNLVNRCLIITFKVPDLEESRVLLNVIPDRIGHGTCIHPEYGGAEDLVNIVEEHSIPIGECK